MSRHRVIEYHKDCSVKLECWENDDREFHSEFDNPAVKAYHENGQIAHKSWYTNDSIHRDNAPAVIQYDEDGCKICDMWWYHGFLHRENGPADVDYDKNGNILKKIYFWYGENITDFVEKIFGEVPDELSKDQVVLLKLSLPEEYFT